MSQPANHPILDHIALRNEWNRQLEESLKQVEQLRGEWERERALQSNQHNHPQNAQNRQHTGESQQDADSPSSQ